MSSSLARKIGLLFVVSSCGAFISLFVFWSFHAQTDPTSINLAGRQRMLAVQLGSWADMVASGQDADRAGLRERVATFDLVLTVLEQGGEIDGYVLPRPPADAAEAVAKVKAVWSDLRPRLLVIAGRPAASPEFERARRDLRSAIEALRMRSDEVTSLLEGQNRAQRERIFWILGTVAALSLALLALGLWYARRFIVRPIQLIEGAARRVHDGDLSARVHVPRGNEISSLAQTFNEMADKVQDLLMARKRAQEALREAERVGRIGSYVLDIPADAWKSSTVMDAIFGIGADFPRTVAGWRELVHPSQRDEMLSYFHDIVVEHRRFEQEYRIVRATDSAERWVLGLGEVEYDADGTPLRMVGVIQDITERKLAEEELTRARDELEQLLSTSPAVTYRAKATGGYGAIYVSSNIMNQLGYEPREFIEDSSFWASHIHPDDRERVFAEQPRLFETGHHTREYRFLHKDGIYRWMRDDLRLIRDVDGKPVEIVGSWVDITENKRLESKFLQAQKMEAVGQLTGGIAHDFNNLLTAVLGYSELALEKLDAGDPARGAVEEVSRAAERAAVLTRQLLAFSRQQILEPKVLDLNAVVADLEKLLRRTIGEDIELIANLSADLGRVRVDPGQIGQALLNLALNARDAMPDGGCLTIETADVELDEEYANTHPPAKPGPHVILAITDSGHGMDEETRSRVFEPFFTTKAKGEGTGLGLSTVYGIVKQSGGYIWAHSEPGQGTTFKIYLPRVEEVAETERRPKAVAESEGGSETILLVEDEEIVRIVATQILENKGYRVLVAQDPEEALQIWQNRGGSIELVVTDVVMPGSTGVELVDQITKRNPGMKALFMSGYAGREIFRDGHLEPDMHFLGKPFTAEALTRKVRGILDGRQVAEGVEKL